MPKDFVAVLFAGFVALGVLDWFYFFTAPLVLTIAIALCLGWALVGIHHDTRPR